jgi:PAS domain S-box-containing protein
MGYRSLSPGFAASFILPVTAGVFAIGIFIVDTITPLDIAVAVLYVIVVLVAGAYFQRRGVLLVSTGCLALTVLSYLLSHGFSTETALLRCLVSLAAIAITTFLALKNQSADLVLREQARLLDLTHDTVFVRDRSDAITYWNRGAEELYGWTREEAVGKASHQLMQTIFPAPLEEINAELLRAGRWEGELVHTKRDGTQVVVASRWSIQQDEQGRPVAILETNNDITERKKADAALRESERRYRNIFQTTGVSIWEEDFSQVQAAIDDLKARGVRDFRQYLAQHPEFVEQAIAMVKVVDVNNATVKLFGARTKDELLASLHKVFTPETAEVFAGELIAFAEGRSSFESETVLQTLKGGKLAVLFTIAFPPEPAKMDSVLVSIMDITERKQTQEALQQARAELAHVTRVTTLGELTASIAHEVNQPIAAVVTNAGAGLRWLAAQPPDLEEARQTLHRIIKDGNRASEVIGRIRALVKKAPARKDRLDINETVLEVVALTRSEAERNRVSLQTRLAKDLPRIPGDRIQLQQVILNLIVNALEAMSGESAGPRGVLISSEKDGSKSVIVAVRDSGAGLGSVSLEQLFDAFYTTKPDGMGMGLAISRSIIEAHGGRLWATPNVPQGAVFQFTLPAGEREA